MSTPADAIARIFGVELTHGGNAVEYVYPGQPGWVIGQNHIATMHWGFPRTLKGKSGQLLKPRPVNNARSDNLASNFWRSSFEHRRCLIPLTAFAEPEGIKGGKTRTWLSLPGHELFTCAGLWRDSNEWGRVYSMVITDPSEQVSTVHDRMPVILSPDRRHEWLTGSLESAMGLCRPYLGDLRIDRTDELWAGGSPDEIDRDRLRRRQSSAG